MQPTNLVQFPARSRGHSFAGALLADWVRSGSSQALGRDQWGRNENPLRPKPAISPNSGRILASSSLSQTADSS